GRRDAARGPAARALLPGPGSLMTQTLYVALYFGKTGGSEPTMVGSVSDASEAAVREAIRRFLQRPDAAGAALVRRVAPAGRGDWSDPLLVQTFGAVPSAMPEAPRR